MKGRRRGRKRRHELKKPLKLGEAPAANREANHVTKHGQYSMDSANKPKRQQDRVHACLIADNLTWREKVCLALIAEYDGKTGAFPSRRKLASDMKLNALSQISDITADLEKKGVLVKQVRDGKSTVYTIQYHNLTRQDSTTPPSRFHYPPRQDSTTHNKEYNKDINNPPVSPLTAQGGRRRNRKQSTLDITAQGVSGFLENHNDERQI